MSARVREPIRFWLIIGSVGLACLALAAPWTVRVILESSESRAPRAACLLYHRFVDEAQFQDLNDEERLYAITTARFEAQIDALRDDGWHVTSLEEVIDLASMNAVERSSGSTHDKLLLITIDDGCQSIISHLEPILRRRGWRAAIFITTDPMADVFKSGHAAQPRMTDAEIRSLDAALFDVGSHGHTHRPLNQLDNVDLDAELRGSQITLAALTGRAVTTLSIPGNWYDARVLSLAHRAGYHAVFTSDAGTIHPGRDPIGLPRINVPGYLAPEQLVSRLAPTTIAQRRMTQASRRMLRPLLGEATADQAATLIWEAGRWPETLIPLGVHIGIAAFEARRRRERANPIPVTV